MSIKATIYNTEGKAVGERELDPAIFSVPISPGLLHQVTVSQRANERRVVAKTLGRGEVRGGGRKPWRQKGTGRARHGSIRSPLWRGGGVTFGPTSERVFKQKINQKVRQKAFRMALSDKAENKKIILLENFKLDDQKTKRAARVFANLNLAAKGRIESTLVALSEKELGISRLIRNIPRVSPRGVKNINAIEALSHQYLLMTVEGLEELEKNLKPKALTAQAS